MKKIVMTIGFVMIMAGTAFAQVMGGVPGGNVAGPSSATDGYSVCFDGTTGKLLKECGGAIYLSAIAALTPTDSNFIVGNGTTWVAESGATARTSLGVAIGTDVQAYHASLASIAGLTETNGGLLYGTADNVYAWLAAGTSGYLLKGNGAAAPSWTNLLSGVTIGGFTASAGMVPLTDGSGNLANSYFFISGPASTAKTYTLPNETVTIATDSTSQTLNFATTGTISGAIPSTTDNNGMTITAAQAYGYMHWATGAGTWVLPAAVAGMSCCVYSTTAAAVVVDPNGTDVITLNGTALAAGAAITSASAAGDFICVMSQSANNWVTLGRSGAWTGP